MTDSKEEVKEFRQFNNNNVVTVSSNRNSAKKHYKQHNIKSQHSRNNNNTTETSLVKQLVSALKNKDKEPKKKKLSPTERAIKELNDKLKLERLKEQAHYERAKRNVHLQNTQAAAQKMLNNLPHFQNPPYLETKDQYAELPIMAHNTNMGNKNIWLDRRYFITDVLLPKKRANQFFKDTQCPIAYAPVSKRCGSQHPYCRTMREFARKQIYMDLIRENDVLLAVGDTGVKYNTWGCEQVHVLAPLLDVKDYNRHGFTWNNKIKRGKACVTKCNCKLQDLMPQGIIKQTNCNHVDLDKKKVGIMMVHSLYYFTKKDIIEIVNTLGPITAVVHKFEGNEGKIFGEANWVREGNMIHMKAIDDNSWYSHPNIEWLFGGTNKITARVGLVNKSAGFVMIRSSKYDATFSIFKIPNDLSDNNLGEIKAPEVKFEPPNIYKHGKLVPNPQWKSCQRSKEISEAIENMAMKSANYVMSTARINSALQKILLNIKWTPALTEYKKIQNYFVETMDYLQDNLFVKLKKNAPRMNLIKQAMIDHAPLTREEYELFMDRTYDAFAEFGGSGMLKRVGVFLALTAVALISWFSLGLAGTVQFNQEVPVQHYQSFNYTHPMVQSEIVSQYQMRHPQVHVTKREFKSETYSQLEVSLSAVVFVTLLISFYRNRRNMDMGSMFAYLITFGMITAYFFMLNLPVLVTSTTGTPENWQNYLLNLMMSLLLARIIAPKIKQKKFHYVKYKLVYYGECLHNWKYLKKDKDTIVVHKPLGSQPCTPKIVARSYGFWLVRYKGRIHQNCLCSEVACIYNRMAFGLKEKFGSKYGPNLEFQLQWRKWCIDNVHNMFYTDENDFPDHLVMSREEWIQTIRGHKRIKMQKCYEQYDIHNYRRKWDQVKPFMKTEMILGKSKDDLHAFNPRLIQGRHDQNNIRWGNACYTFGKILKKAFSLEGKCKYVTYSSGMNRLQLGNWYAQCLFEMEGMDVVVYESDFSKYEKTTRKIHFSTQFAIMRELLIFSDEIEGDEFDKSCESMLQMEGTMKHGTYFKGNTGRSSGSQDTTIGNSLLNALAHLYLLETVEGDIFNKDLPFRMLVLGDDCFVLTTRKIGTKMVNSDAIKKIGFVAKTRLLNKFEGEFCSSYFVPVLDKLGNKTFYLEGKSGRALAKGFTSFKKLGIKRQIQYNFCVSACMMVEHGHNPILRPLLEKIFKLSTTMMDSANYDKNAAKKWFHKWMNNPYKFKSISVDQYDTTLIWFMYKYGITWEEFENWNSYVAGIDSVQIGIDHVVLDKIIKVDIEQSFYEYQQIGKGTDWFYDRMFGKI